MLTKKIEGSLDVSGSITMNEGKTVVSATQEIDVSSLSGDSTIQDLLDLCDIVLNPSSFPDRGTYIAKGSFQFVNNGSEYIFEGIFKFNFNYTGEWYINLSYINPRGNVYYLQSSGVDALSKKFSQMTLTALGGPIPRPNSHGQMVLFYTEYGSFKYFALDMPTDGGTYVLKWINGQPEWCVES